MICKYNRVRLFSLPFKTPVRNFFWWCSIFFLHSSMTLTWPVQPYDILGCSSWDSASFSYSIFPLIFPTRDYLRSALYQDEVYFKETCLRSAVKDLLCATNVFIGNIKWNSFILYGREKLVMWHEELSSKI